MPCLLRRAPRRRRAAGCWPRRRRRSRRSARPASARPRTSDRAAPRRRRAESWRRCRRPPRRECAPASPARRPCRLRDAGALRTSRSTAVFSPLKLKSTGARSRPADAVRRRLRACDRRASAGSPESRHARSLPLPRERDRSPARPDIRARAASRPCRRPPPPHRRASGRSVGSAPGSADRGTGWCGRRRRPAPPPAAAARRARGRATRCVRRDDGPERAEMPRDHGERLRERHADEQRPDEPGPLRDRHARRCRRASTPACVERLFDDAADVAHVLARRELGDDTAPLAMDRRLRRDDVRARAPRPRRVAGLRR